MASIGSVESTSAEADSELVQRKPVTRHSCGELSAAVSMIVRCQNIYIYIYILAAIAQRRQRKRSLPWQE